VLFRSIDARPGDRFEPVATGVVWACGCTADGPSYHELLLTACVAHAIPSDDDPSTDSRLHLSPPG
jgi:hypothetical protein